MILNTSLLRERFTIFHPDKDGREIVQAVGNRILLSLVSKNGEVRERLIVRAHSMHITLRLAALITHEFHKSGPLLNRQIPFPWQKAWDDITFDFEHTHVPETWCCIYSNGRPVFSRGEYHPFLDVIEQCDIKNRAEYDRAVGIAENVFKQAGKIVQIEHDVNIALVIGVMEDKTRCGLILRAPTRTTTFNFQIEPLNTSPQSAIQAHHGLVMAADFLEAIQLAVTTGFVQSQINIGKIRDASPAGRKAKAALKRIGRLNQSILSFESLYAVRYRPEKPDFTEILETARGLDRHIRI